MKQLSASRGPNGRNHYATPFLLSLVTAITLAAIALQYQRFVILFQTAMNGLLLLVLILVAAASYSRFAGLRPRWKAVRLPVAVFVLGNSLIGWLYFAAESLFWEWGERIGAPRGVAFALVVLVIFGMGGGLLALCLRILVGTAAVLTAAPFVLPVPWDVKIRWSALHVGVLGVVSVLWIHGSAVGLQSR